MKRRSIEAFVFQERRWMLVLLCFALTQGMLYGQDSLKGHPRDTGSVKPRTDTLAPVIVTPKTIAPKMKGDTLEYNAALVKTRVNATVEELLIRLPGVQVDENGGITVNGKKVERLLVDGEDLFGGDPTIVTRNFNADMIAKVQVLDRKSVQAQFTGVDDGVLTKTLNLTLKEDSKRGYFMKTEAGGDPQGYYNINGLLGAFRDHRQFAALGMMSNTGNTGFSGNIGELGSGLNIGGRINDALGASAGGGIPRVAGGGMHYADRWSGQENHLVGNYSYSALATHPFSSFVSRQTLPDSIYVQQQTASSNNSQDGHNFDGDYDYVPDSLSAFRLSAGGISMQGHNVFSSSGSSSFNDTLVNSSVREIRSDVQNQNFRASVLWRRRARRKKERNLSIVAGMAKQDNSSQGLLYSLNRFYRHDGSLLRTDTVDQRKHIATDGLFMNSSINYTEPLWENAILAASYGLSLNSSESLQETYDRGNGKYDDPLDSLSNRYRNQVITQRATLNLQVRDKIFGYTVGGDLVQFAYTQTDLLKGSALRYHYLNFSPRVTARWNIDAYRRFDLSYNGGTQQPSVTQLQPVQNNNDPLRITIGNPDLHPGFSHSMNITFHRLKGAIINAGANFGLLTNGISTRTNTDSLGRQVSQAVNVNGTHNAGLSVGINQKIKPIDLDAGFNMTFSYARNVNYVNADLSRNDNYTTSGGINLNKFVSDRYSFRIGSNISYTYAHSSINAGAANHYLTQSHDCNVSVYLLKLLEINTGLRYNWRQKLDNFDRNNATLLWNALLHLNACRNRLDIRWQVFDILAQNAGINRYTYANQTVENTSNVLGRHWMVSASWRMIHH